VYKPLRRILLTLPVLWWWCRWFPADSSFLATPSSRCWERGDGVDIDALRHSYGLDAPLGSSTSIIGMAFCARPGESFGCTISAAAGGARYPYTIALTLAALLIGM